MPQERKYPLSNVLFLLHLTFPDDWKFCGSVQSQYKQVGNAVPVNLAYDIALEIHKSLEEIK